MSSRGYPLLLGGIASWFGFWGSHMVVFQWLLVDHLDASPEQVGTAQMAITLPSLLFLLVGGATADRLDPRRMIVSIHLLTGALVAGLAFALTSMELRFAALLPYAVAVGTLQAFAFPARDTLLSEVVRGAMSRAVAGTTLTQHAVQVVGSFLAGSAGLLGAVPVLGALAAWVACGALPLQRLPTRAKRQPPARLSLAELRAGIVEVARSRVLLPVLLLAMATGILYVGPYLVVLPLLVRDVYQGGAQQMAILNAMFPLGSVMGGGVILWRGGIQRTGRALVIGQVFASFCVGALATDLPFAGSVAAVLGWGLAGALFINAGRTLFQSHASEAHRGRVLSVYTLGVMGGAPIGALLTGLAATPLGLHGTLAAAAVIALSVAVAVGVSTSLWHENELHDPQVAARPPEA
jgi:MFS family permease